MKLQPPTSMVGERWHIRALQDRNTIGGEG